MRFDEKPAARGLAALLAATVLAAAHGSALAQSAAPANPAPKPAAKPPAKKPATAQRVTAPPSNGEVSDGKDYWSIDYSALNHYRDQRGATPAASNVPEVRRPLQNAPGSFGLETTRRVSATELHDGSTAPGITANTQKE